MELQSILAFQSIAGVWESHNHWIMKVKAAIANWERASVSFILWSQTVLILAPYMLINHTYCTTKYC